MANYVSGYSGEQLEAVLDLFVNKGLGSVNGFVKRKSDGTFETGSASTGTVTSVGVANGGGLSVTGSPITTSGTITIGHSNSVTAQSTQAVYPIKIDGQGHISAYGSAVTIGAAAAKGVTDNSSATAVTSTDTNLITGRTLYYAGYTKNTGTITGITMNGASKGTSGVVDLGTVITAHQDISGKADKSATVSTVTWDSTNNKLTKTINGTTSDVVTLATIKSALGSMPASDVYAWAKASSKPSYTASEVGAIATSEKGANSGVAELDAGGKVPSSQLPSFVDDVLEYDSQSGFPTTGETGKIYIAKDTNKTYRWSGSAYTEISASLALGETSSTAYRGDRGAAAYTHAVTNKGSAFTSGLYKITTNSEGHVTAATAVAKSDITALGIPGENTTYSAGTGLTLSGTKFNHSNSVTAQTTQALYPIKIDAQGHISAYGSAVSVPTSAANHTTGVTVGDHSTTTIYGVQSSTTTASKASGSNGSAPSLTYTIDGNDSHQLNISWSAGSASTWSFSDVTVPIKDGSTTTVVTSKTHTVNDSGHTHTLS